VFLQALLLVGEMWLGELTRQRPKRTKFEDFIKDNAPSEIRPIPYAGGTIELTPSRAWFGDFLQRAVERDSHWTDYLWAGLSAALLDTITVAYRSYIGEMFPLCWGPDTHVERITINDRPVFAAVVSTDNAGGGFLIDDPQAWGGDQPPGEGGEYAWCDVTRGNYTEPTNAYLESLLTTPPNRTPALHGISCLVKRGPSGFRESGYFAAGGVGVTPKLKLWKVVIRRQPDNLATGFNRIGRHMNPMEVIYEWSTSLEYGAKIPLQYLNLDNWRSVAQALYDEGTGWSGRIENQTSPIAVVKDILAQIDAVDEPSPSLGLTIRLIRRTYSIGSLRILNRDNITRVERFTPGTYEDTKNKVQVEFPDQDNNFKGRKALYIDPANQLIQGGRVVPQSETFLGVADFEQANVIDTRDGRAISLPRAPLDCFVFPSWGRLTYRGEVVLFQWESPTFSIVMRVLKVTPNGPDEKDFHLELIEDQFSTGLRTFGEPGPTLHEDPGAGLDVAPPSASWNSVELPPDGLKLTLTLTNTNQFQPMIEGGIVFDEYTAGGQYTRIYVTEPGGAQTLSPMHLVPDENNEAIFQWPAFAVGEYEFCVQTFSTRGVTNGMKVCATIDVSAVGSPSISPSASVSPSTSPSISPSSSVSSSVSPSVSPSSSVSASASSSTSSSLSPSASQSPSSSASASVSPSSSGSPSSSASASVSPSPSTSPSSSVSPSAPADPNTIASVWMWGEPSRETGLSDGDPMPQLSDQSGNSRAWTQATASFKPINKVSILNGLACARGEGFHAGVAQFWDGPSLASLTAAHIFIVVKCDTEGVGTVDNGLWDLGTDSGNTDYYPWSDNNIYDGSLSNARKTVGTHAALTSWRVVEVISTSSEWTYKLDGTQLFTTGTNTVAGRSNPLLMHNHGNDALKGYLAGFYIFSAKLTTDRATMVAYINDRFALSMS